MLLLMMIMMVMLLLPPLLAMLRQPVSKAMEMVLQGRQLLRTVPACGC